MPQSLRLLYEQAELAPALHLLNFYRFETKNFEEKKIFSFVFRANGRGSMKLYTNPSFFLNYGCNQ